MPGFDTLLSVRLRLVADRMKLTEGDIKNLLDQTDGLALLKGKWIEVDHEKLKELLERLKEITLS